MRSVVLAGGGSAGHVSPLLALADRLRARHPEATITALGTVAGLESRLVPARGYTLETLPKVTFPRRLDAAAFSLPARLARAVRAADRVVAGADVVVGFGGYVASPAYLAARRRGIPIVVHEQNARPGLANRLGASLSRHVGVTFPDTPLPHATVVGMPLRREIADLDRAALRGDALAHYGLDPQRPTLLVTGGSLGAQRLNTVLGETAPALLHAGIQVVHLCGRGKDVDLSGVAGEHTDGGVVAESGARYVVRQYADRMELAYAAADLVVCRSGANTVCELTAVGLPAIFVPLPIGNGEQRVNATQVVDAGGARIVDDASFTPDVVRTRVLPLLTDTERLTQMAAASASCGERDADDRLADLVEAAVADRKGR
ncbi:undecaprenyldiphospho-muramoylpentapeptide beta-N-acetylglucosaminyltransferase [Mobilicoccus pelagius]|uniref:UDP-N-acetylglucosamine--N-acetylmuramyl-(pentapeptide) pyrophosphoryl-undecaprenol N-acetylglucosamine transferase n=1 Tax=Mobilicoccus pelagius NBRC 104925 TaxID=1089455 RepID=H5UQG4_9MICO|nr:undecaprenyldiphospho-muramoylpentapeptide beta-N-acetylglucosaminyltransferase [Mobilicoccus pelagius]GAB47972.1 UDP-N-acetylglucosamine--N-acetylmuramyl-(pentapeptide) pyrophosphoryl-undecaprenol N-acetylglucosamine transferase [Mobilicoccus pelagius NBRC 104925]